jgi:hypothetical protein
MNMAYSTQAVREAYDRIAVTEDEFEQLLDRGDVVLLYPEVDEILVADAGDELLEIVLEQGHHRPQSG